MRTTAALYSMPLLASSFPADDTIAFADVNDVPNFRTVLDWVAVSYDAAPTDAATIVQANGVGSVPIYTMPVRSTGPYLFDFRSGGHHGLPLGDARLRVIMSAAGAGIAGKINYGYRLVRRVEDWAVAREQYYTETTTDPATATLAAAENVYHKLNWIHCGYSAAPTGGNLLVTVGGTEVLNIDIIGTVPQILNELNIVSNENEAIVVTLADGTVTQYLNFGYE